MRCPCLSGSPYAECCGPVIDGTKAAPTAERLMRSRFAAFALGNREYLRESWHPSTRPAMLELEPQVRWYRLDIVGRTAGGLLDTDGTVEFTAHFRSPDGAGELHENSRFVRENGRWYYLSAL